MNKFRPLIAAVFCTAAGIACLTRYYSGQPALAELTEISGEVEAVETGTRVNKYGTGKYPVIRLRGVAPVFKYLDWFPEPEKLRTSISAGDKVTVWVDRGGNDWLWQIERQGEKIVKYDDIVAAVKRNSRFDQMMGYGLLLAAAFAVHRYLKKRRA